MPPASGRRRSPAGPSDSTEKVLWKHNIRDARDKGPLVDSALTPPAVVNGKFFIGTTAGQVICMNAETGAELWRATVGGSAVRG